MQFSPQVAVAVVDYVIVSIDGYITLQNNTIMKVKWNTWIKVAWAPIKTSQDFQVGRQVDSN